MPSGAAWARQKAWKRQEGSGGCEKRQTRRRRAALGSPPAGSALSPAIPDTTADDALLLRWGPVVRLRGLLALHARF
jgi:hypothetical protein